MAELVWAGLNIGWFGFLGTYYSALSFSTTDSNITNIFINLPKMKSSKSFFINFRIKWSTIAQGIKWSKTILKKYIRTLDELPQFLYASSFYISRWVYIFSWHNFCIFVKYIMWIITKQIALTKLNAKFILYYFSKYFLLTSNWLIMYN
jgi:hypothetical protein